MDKETGWGSSLKGWVPSFKLRWFRTSFQCCPHGPLLDYEPLQSLEFPSITTSAPCADPSALPALTGTEDGTTLERLFFGRNGRFSAVSVKRVVLTLYEDEDTKYKFHLSQSTR